MSNVAKADKTYIATKADFTRKAVNTKIKGIGLDTSKIKYNQSPVETPNGSNKVFTLPDSHEYISTLLEVYLDGLQQIKDVDWAETTVTTFTFTTAPDSDEAIKLSYVKT